MEIKLQFGVISNLFGGINDYFKRSLFCHYVYLLPNKIYERKEILRFAPHSHLHICWGSQNPFGGVLKL